MVVRQQRTHARTDGRTDGRAHRRTGQRVLAHAKRFQTSKLGQFCRDGPCMHAPPRGARRQHKQATSFQMDSAEQVHIHNVRRSFDTSLATIARTFKPVAAHVEVRQQGKQPDFRRNGS